MKRYCLSVSLAVSMLWLPAARSGAAGPAADARIDAAFAAFWRASTAEESADASAALIASGVTFDDALRRLKLGRRYTAAVPTGVVRLSRRADGDEFSYSFDVPRSYDPSRKYRVRFQLHGGVGAGEDNRRRGTGAIGTLAGDEQIYVLPTSWLDRPWWSEAQVRNLRAILDDLKRRYNIDENRVVLSGVSDGATAAFYVAMTDPTPFASLLPLNGSLMVLAGRILALGDLFPNNLLNRPFFIVNGERDMLYPTSAIDPIVRHLQRAGVQIDYEPQPDAGHDTAWWPEVRPVFERFVRDHVRHPLPDVLTWQKGDHDSFNRVHWLVIDRLGSEQVSLPDVNQMPTPQTLHFGILTTGPRVTRVIPESNAADLGVQVGDVIVRLDGEPLPADADVAQALARCCQPGTTIDLQLLRGRELVATQGIYEPRSIYGMTVPLFARRAPNGRVDLVKSGNTVRATAGGVAAYTLLLSPDAFDLTKPLTVITNGRVSFEGRVDRSLATLLKWAAIDNDRTMLFAAELHVN
jgi:hypothetical protein